MPLLDRVFRHKRGKSKKTAPKLHGSETAEDELVQDATNGSWNRDTTGTNGSTGSGDATAPEPSENLGSSFFPNASNTVFSQPVTMAGSLTNMMHDNSTVIRKLAIINNIDQGKPVLDALSREMTQGAGVDSSARYPPPKCYPGTRKSLTAKTRKWLLDDHRAWDVLWLHGPAGVGKSAVAQTIAEFAKDNRRLGAAFFFSKSNKRKDFQPVFITLAYQLAVRFPGYLPLVAKELGADPDLLKKAPDVQFRQLIVEPLSSLPTHPKHLIVLDGLDECDGEAAQLHIVELINSLILSKISLPIIWMICSRPEPHLMRALSRGDFPIQCWREELAIDTEESRDDTSRFIRTRFKEIHDRYGDFVEEDAMGVWPPEEDVMTIIDEASGLFIFASTILKYIEDAGSGNPDARLAEVLSVIRHSQATGSRSPMETLDKLYTLILSEVPEDIWPVTHRLLKILVCPPQYSFSEPCTPRLLSNLLGITRSKFYAAMHKLHSVLDVPTPNEADARPLRFLHASFRDYLVQPTRSGRFCASLPPDFKGNDELQKACLRFMSSPLPFLLESAYKLTITLRPLVPNLSEPQAEHALSRCLAWPFPDRKSTRQAAEHLIRLAQGRIFLSYDKFPTQDDQHTELKSMLCAFDYNSLTFSHYGQGNLGNGLRGFIRWVKGTSLHDLVRTHSISETDDKLLSRLRNTKDKVKRLNLTDDKHLSSVSNAERIFFMLGYGTNTVLVAVGPEDSAPNYYSIKSAVEIWPSLAEWSGEPNVTAAQSGPIE